MRLLRRKLYVIPRERIVATRRIFSGDREPKHLISRREGYGTHVKFRPNLSGGVLIFRRAQIRAVDGQL